MAVEQARSGVALKGTQVRDAYITRKPQTYLGMALSSLRRDRLTVSAMFFVLLITLLAIGAEAITGAIGVDPTSTNPSNQFQQPYIGPYVQWVLGIDPISAPVALGKANGVPHWLGTDQLGRDQLARLLYGARVSLSIALVAAALSMILGVGVGAIAGYFGGRVDDVVMWFIATLTTIPEIYLLIIVNSIFKPTPVTLTLFLGFLGWFGTARFMRGNVFKVRSLEYTTAARSLGATNFRIMLRHVIPNSLPIIVVITAVDVGALILTESILSFLGLGVQPPTPTWGNMLYRANDFVFLRDPVTKSLTGLHLLIWPGVLISLTVLSFYLIGDGLRDALDPMLKNKK
ncbi:MAG: ABC transporter permease [Caldilineaceae bacterium]|nr:ABC transporter permease [Caldilineaceae bacterium]